MYLPDMLVPSLEEAKTLLEAARIRNPTPWVEHSIFAARAARAIAELDDDLDPEIAETIGLLHDIGRQEGITDMRHTLDGYNCLHALGYEDAARICITHSFPIEDAKGTKSSPGRWDCTDEEIRFIDEYLREVEFTDYDRLIQLCDSLALPSGYCRLEQRFVDLVLRRGFNDFTVPRWRAYMELLEYFGRRVGRPVYDVLSV